MAPSLEEFRALLSASEQFWHEGDRAGYIELWSSRFPGGFTFEMPVGTSPRVGVDACRGEIWDEWNRSTRYHTTKVMVCGDEAATVTENLLTVDGVEVEMTTVETWRFGDDGSCAERVYM